MGRTSPPLEEKAGLGKSKSHTAFSAASASSDEEKLAAAPQEAEIVNKFAWVERVPLLSSLFRQGAVELRGIERVPEEEREPRHAWNNLLMWISINAVLTTVPIGMLAQAFFTLTLPHAIAVIIVFSAIGSATVAFIATLGPQTGLRTMVITRYSVGYVGGSIFSILNILTQLGFSVIAVILGGQTLYNISEKLPLVVGVIIVSLVTLIVCFIGYDALHYYERYAWILLLIIFCMMYGLGGKAGYDPGAQVPLEDRGVDLAGDVLSFGGIIFSSASGWAPVAADFNCRLPANTPPYRVFLLTFIGLMIPLIFVETLGAALMTITLDAYTSAYENGDAGGLIAQTLTPWGGFGKFLLVLLAFSVIANNIPNTYSAALSIQALCPWFQRIPRAIWTVVVFVIYTVAGVAGREHFSSILSNFLAVLGYWTAFFIVIVAEEHYIFRRKHGMLGGYDLTAYDSFARLPVGIAGIFAGCCGVAGAVIGMAETWYIGPVAAHIGPFGGDLGFELAAVFSGIVYPPCRYLEIKYFGR
ncbi:hypothetical protein CALVIDRAFT_178789 [Calocera viscosa TUFC12733]|uniref:Cytosine-purine permease n=1 Tax=Calocera viscosa (strain TUFC12733) TaxID=1330018 RepID=A0A167KXY3_CALVF|nr:hypothetical protein CALVIDRAFT_178789 [Calocera viscosa TUFC12733]